MEPDPTLRIQNLFIHLSREEVLVDGVPIALSSTEYHLLCLLAQNPGVVFTRQQIIQRVRGADYPATDRSVDNQLVGLSKEALVGRPSDRHSSRCGLLLRAINVT